MEEMMTNFPLSFKEFINTEPMDTVNNFSLSFMGNVDYLPIVKASILSVFSFYLSQNPQDNLIQSNSLIKKIDAYTNDTDYFEDTIDTWVHPQVFPKSLKKRFLANYRAVRALRDWHRLVAFGILDGEENRYEILKLKYWSPDKMKKPEEPQIELDYVDGDFESFMSMDEDDIVNALIKEAEELLGKD